MSVLVVAEINRGELAEDATARALKAACQIGDVTVLVAGQNVKAAADEVAGFAGVKQVLLAESVVLANGLAEPLADLISSIAGDYSHVIAPSTTSGKNVMPRVAALRDVMIISDITAVLDDDSFERLIFAGNAVQTVKTGDPCKVITVRTSTFDPVGKCEQKADIKSIDVSVSAGSSRWVEDAVAQSERPDLSSAKVVVSGGRGIGAKENFAIIEDLAYKLGAAVGASRAAVDSGFAPNDWQVGQTGKIVAPDLYIAVGISGAIQHLAGMKDSKVIVAINKDEEAPIFQVADYGLVADLFDAIPEMSGKVS